jgi:hypothetical protein
MLRPGFDRARLSVESGVGDQDCSRDRVEILAEHYPPFALLLESRTSVSPGVGCNGEWRSAIHRIGDAGMMFDSRV